MTITAISYLIFVSSGFVHEGGHSVVGNWVGIEIAGFSPAKCLRLDCKVYPLESLEGWQGNTVLFAGGITASLWWLAIYLVTTPWHRKGGWLIGGITAALIAGELTTGIFEGGWNWFYSNYQVLTLIMIVITMVAGFFVQLRFASQTFRVHLFIQGIRSNLGPDREL